MSTTAKRKAKPKASRKVAAKPRTTKKRTAPVKKPVQTPPQAPQPKKETVAQKTFLLAIRVKGSFGTPWPYGTTLTSLRLKAKFNAVLVENRPETIGMLRHVKDYITWGEVKTAEIATLLRERGEFSGGLAMTDETVRKRFGEASVQDLATALTAGRISLQTLRQGGLNPVFRLRSPSGGFEGSTKRPYGTLGELGQRRQALSSLLTQMM